MKKTKQNLIRVLFSLILSMTVFIVLPTRAADSARSVVVTGHVDESITIRQEGNQIFVGTNYNSGLAVFQDDKITRLDRPSETTFDSNKGMIISPNL